MSARNKSRSAQSLLESHPDILRLIVELERRAINAHERRNGSNIRDLRTQGAAATARLALAESIKSSLAHAGKARLSVLSATIRKQQLQLKHLMTEKSKLDIKRVQLEFDVKELAARARADRIRFGENPGSRSRAVGFRHGQRAAVERILVGSCPYRDCAVRIPSLLTAIENSGLQDHMAITHEAQKARRKAR